MIWWRPSGGSSTPLVKMAQVSGEALVATSPNLVCLGSLWVGGDNTTVTSIAVGGFSGISTLNTVTKFAGNITRIIRKSADE